jgi:nucleotidyltransferase substrate binding protein (TIGR01987 family)
MTSSRLDLGSLRHTIASLEAALGLVGNTIWFDAQSEPLRNTLVAGVVQNFEFVYELCIKMIRREPEREADSAGAIDRLNFRDLMRVAGEQGVIADVEAWFDYRRIRNQTSHTYDQGRAWQAYQDAKTFIGDARALLVSLEARNV